MRRYSANYIFTGVGNPIRNGIVGVDFEGNVIEIIDPHGNEKELANTEFHNGVIVPGFVNAHCHTELSYLKGKIPMGKGLPEFVDHIRDFRLKGELYSNEATQNALNDMHRLGTVAVADICNSPNSFEAKKACKLAVTNLIEVFGVEPNLGDSVIDRARLIKSLAQNCHLTPHSTYTLSEMLWEKLSKEIDSNPHISIHIAESPDEKEFTTKRRGGISNNYKQWGLPTTTSPAGTPVEIVKRYLPSRANILFVHNTFLTKEEARELKSHFANASFVLCPTSNLFIENTLPDIKMLSTLGLNLTLGTDSLASTTSLCMLKEIVAIREHFPSIPFQETLQWATINGAKVMGLGETFGSIEVGKKPGLNLISAFDFSNMSPNKKSRVKRLV